MSTIASRGGAAKGQKGVEMCWAKEEDFLLKMAK